MTASQNLLEDGRADKARDLLDTLADAGLPDHIMTAVREMAGRASRRRIFDGKSFEGWEGDLDWFRIAEGAVVAGSMSMPIPRNEFLCSLKSYADFELRLRVRLIAGMGNGGIQFRSERVPNSREMSGYQADVALEYWGGLYDESRRNRFLARPDAAAVAKVLRPDGWNDYTIRCEGPRIRLWLNGMQTVDFTETDAAVPREGIIGLQIHGGAPRKSGTRRSRLRNCNHDNKGVGVGIWNKHQRGIGSFIGDQNRGLPSFEIKEGVDAFESCPANAGDFEE